MRPGWLLLELGVRFTGREGPILLAFLSRKVNEIESLKRTNRQIEEKGVNDSEEVLRKNNSRERIRNNAAPLQATCTRC